MIALGLLGVGVIAIISAVFIAADLYVNRTRVHKVVKAKRAYDLADSPEYVRIFGLSKIESDLANAWLKQHDKTKCKPLTGYHGAIGGAVAFKFTTTGIGNFIYVHCNVCHLEKNITDLDKL